MSKKESDPSEPLYKIPEWRIAGLLLFIEGMVALAVHHPELKFIASTLIGGALGLIVADACSLLKEK